MDRFKIPKQLPILISENVLLPGCSIRIPVSSYNNMQIMERIMRDTGSWHKTVIGILSSDDKDEEEFNVIGRIGTIANITSITGINWPATSYNIRVKGLFRFKVDDVLQENPFIIGKTTLLNSSIDDDTFSVTPEFENSWTELNKELNKLIDLMDLQNSNSSRLKRILQSVPKEQFPDLCMSLVESSNSEKLEVLNTVDLVERYAIVNKLIKRQIKSLLQLQESYKGIYDNVSNFPKKKSLEIKSPDNHHLKRIRGLDEMEQKIRKSKMPSDIMNVALDDLQTLRKTPKESNEYSSLWNYLCLMVELPWQNFTEDNLDIENARIQLDKDHYGLEKVKKRIIEYLAVCQLKNTLKGPIVCLVGPPGVGKTSIGKSIAKAMGRKFCRISLGGVCDQSDIRGHRRTYVASMPGRIINALKNAGVSNPVILLDEVDKLSKGVQGDPSAALLEVLDPEQNHTFTDHYLNVPFDLSKVLFIATANSIKTISRALFDRMEVIHIPGYALDEKARIASDFLVEKQLLDNGLNSEQIRIPENSISLIISKYTQEAGVRSLERKIAAICRAIAVKLASEKKYMDLKDEMNEFTDENNNVDVGKLVSDNSHLPYVIDETVVADILGPYVYNGDQIREYNQPGMAIGLSWSEVGGGILYIEASTLPGDGKLILTGHLGDVMKESANLALNWIKSNTLGLQKLLPDNSDIHIHFPHGGVPKDGPSAGVTIACALISLFTDVCVRSDIAMTGEISLFGNVLPVGGIKEKVLAAHQAGILNVILPHKNKHDLNEISDIITSEMQFIFVDHLFDVLNVAFPGGLESLNIEFELKTHSKL